MRAAFDTSVCVPTYEGAAFVDECMASIAAQDLRDTEVVVVDDRSTDHTLDVVGSYADRIEHLRVERNDTRLGAVANLNRCIRLSRGRWIKPVFQDDTIEPGCLAAMRAARRPRVPVVVCARRYLYEDGVDEWRRLGCERLLAEALDRRFGAGFVTGARIADLAVEMAVNRLPQINFIGEPVAVLFDRRAARLAGGVDDRYAQLWDFELALRLAVRRGIVVVDEPLASFRVHADSQTARNFAGSALGTDVMDRLRLHTAYARGLRYGPVRAAARRRTPPVDLTALAVGVADAARHLIEDLPADERSAIAATIDGIVRPLPASFPIGWSGDTTAIDAATALYLEFTEDPPPLPPGVPPVVVERRRWGPRASKAARAARAVRTRVGGRLRGLRSLAPGPQGRRRPASRRRPR